MMYRPTSRAPRLAFSFAMAVMVLGCGDSGPARVKVTGVVTHDGKPLEGAAVMYLPDPSNTIGRPAEDETGPEGNYKVRTGGRSGIIPGKYRIVVSKAPTNPAAKAASAAFKDDPFMAELSAGPPSKGKGATAAIEVAFDREVPPEGGVLDFDVVKDKPAGK